MTTRPRWAARADATALAEQLRGWRQKCADAAKKRAMKQRREARKAARKAAKAGVRPRGVDRVPDRLKGLSVTVKQHEVSKAGNPITYETGVWNLPGGHRYYGSNYAERRRLGQRGRWSKSRPPRRRDLPGAVDRRIKRNQKEWA